MKRVNTGFRDGEYQVPAWHMDGNETMIDCSIREAKEELDIDIKDCEVVHISHRISKQEKKLDNREYFDVYVKVNKYSWEIKINEPEKCSELVFIDIENIPENEKKLFSYDLDIIKKIKKWDYFSEIR